MKVAFDNNINLPMGTKGIPFMLDDTVIGLIADTTETEIVAELFSITLQKAWDSDGVTEVYLSKKPHYTQEEYEALRAKEAQS